MIRGTQMFSARFRSAVGVSCRPGCRSTCRGQPEEESVWAAGKTHRNQERKIHSQANPFPIQKINKSLKDRKIQNHWPVRRQVSRFEQNNRSNKRPFQRSQKNDWKNHCTCVEQIDFAWAISWRKNRFVQRSKDDHACAQEIYLNRNVIG